MNESSQPHFEELISAYLDGELRGDELRSVEELLRENAELRHVYEELCALRGVLQSLPRHTLDDNFYKRVLNRADVQLSQSDPPNSDDDAAAAALLHPPTLVARQPDRTAALQSSWRRGLFWGVASCAAAVTLLLISFPAMRDLAEAPFPSSSSMGESATALPEASSTMERGAGDGSTMSDGTAPPRGVEVDGAATFSKAGASRSPSELAKGGMAKGGMENPRRSRSVAQDQLPGGMSEAVPSEDELPDWLLRTAVDQNVDYIVQVDSEEGEQAVDKINRALVANSIAYDVSPERTAIPLSVTEQTRQQVGKDSSLDVGLVSVEGSSEQVLQTIRDIQRHAWNRSVVQVRVVAAQSRQSRGSDAPAQATSRPYRPERNMPERNMPEQRLSDTEQAFAPSDMAEQVANAPRQVVDGEDTSQSGRFRQTPEDRALFRNMAVAPDFGSGRLDRETVASAPAEVSDAAAQVAQEYVESPIAEDSLAEDGLGHLDDRKLQEEQAVDATVAAGVVPREPNRPASSGVAALDGNPSEPAMRDLGVANGQTSESESDEAIAAEAVAAEAVDWSDKLLQNYYTIARDQLAEGRSDQLWVAPPQGRAWFVVPQSGESQLEWRYDNSNNQVDAFAGGGGAVAPLPTDPAFQPPFQPSQADMPAPESPAPSNETQQSLSIGSNALGRNVRALIVLRRGLPVSQLAQDRQSLGEAAPPVTAAPATEAVPAINAPGLDQREALPVPAESVPAGEPDIP